MSGSTQRKQKITDGSHLEAPLPWWEGMKGRGKILKLHNLFTPTLALPRQRGREYRVSGWELGGFSLIELLIAIAISGIVLGAVSSLFIMQNKSYSVQEQVAEMQQNARAAMDIMTREIRMAGCDPKGTAGATITAADTSSITFTQDLNGDGDLMDGSNWDTNERITYSLYTSDGIQKIGRATGAGTNQPVAEHIQSLEIKYWDDTVTDYQDSNMLSRPVASPANIRVIQITITAQTAKPDPDSGSYRTCILTSLITPRNLAY